ncbi:MAG: tRNA lysidine(34) synthetase TilS, partial [Faecousia sp.]
MLNKLSAALREQVAPGQQVVCAVSGGADSVALLFGMYLLREKLQINLSAAHLNHHLRGEESDRDEAFVRAFCDGYGIPLTVGDAWVQPGKKGLEAAAREARYAFLRTLPGKIATAHTADDNAETVLMHLLRGTGLKGLGGIAPVSGPIIRPMLDITRQEVEAFLEEYHLPHREDSSNASDAFLRNRIRHHVMPLLRAENQNVSLGISAMARRLREDEQYLQSQLEPELP